MDMWTGISCGFWRVLALLRLPPFARHDAATGRAAAVMIAAHAWRTVQPWLRTIAAQ